MVAQGQGEAGPALGDRAELLLADRCAMARLVQSVEARAQAGGARFGGWCERELWCCW
jgi:hypothetical protein